MSVRAPVGPINFATQEICIGRGLAAIRATSEIDKEFLYYALLFKQPEIKGNEGAVFSSINKNEIERIEVPLPSLLDQKRIVAILDEAFAGIETSIANTEKNLANARELFESCVKKECGLGVADWPETALGDIVDLLTGFAFKSNQYTNEENSIRLLRGDNIIPGQLRWENVKRWSSADIAPYDRYLLDEGDIVLAMDRTWIKSGIKCAQIRSEDLPCLLVQRVARLRASQCTRSGFLKYVIFSKSFEDYVLSIQTGLGVPHISGGQISEFRFPCPPIEEQITIAEQLDSMSSDISRLTSTYQRKLDSLGELKQSVLQKAFSGELTADRAAREVESATA